MQSQNPAQGILLARESAGYKQYVVVCDCGCKQNDHTVFVEAEDDTVSVHTYTEQTTDYWNTPLALRYDIDNDMLQYLDWAVKGFINSVWHRLKLTKDVWFDGFLKYEACIIMNKQQATNYAATLNDAVNSMQRRNDISNSSNLQGMR